MTTDTIDMKKQVERVMRELRRRDRPARRLITYGAWIAAVGAAGDAALLVAVFVDPGREPLRESLSPTALSMCVLGVIGLIGGVMLRVIRAGQEQLRDEIRSTRPVEPPRARRPRRRRPAGGVESNGVSAGDGAKVIPLPPPDTMDALRRLARKTAGKAEDNSEDRSG